MAFAPALAKQQPLSPERAHSQLEAVSWQIGVSSDGAAPERKADSELMLKAESATTPLVSIAALRTSRRFRGQSRGGTSVLLGHLCVFESSRMRLEGMGLQEQGFDQK
mmetsp:Transcript_107403/g.342353  ORF Transcript_107403/g.342353 Transcript_107403/m.342353 type:complete len:108 (+) Transcript_107403:938-1261(+)